MLARSLFRIFLVSTLGNLVTLVFGYFLVHNHFESNKISLVKSHSLVGALSSDSTSIDRDKPTELLSGHSLFKLELLNKNSYKKLISKRRKLNILFKKQLFKKSLFFGGNRSRAPPFLLS